MSPRRPRWTRTIARTAAIAALGAVAWDVQRRRDLRAVAADPEWAELNRPLEGRPFSVRAHDGTRLHAEIFGPDDAPTIVLVHGWTCDLTLWHYQIRDLSRYLRVVAYDQRGHGRSEVPISEGAYSVEALASDLQSVLDECVPEGERCLVAGHSMGGMTILAWAGEHPRAVADRLAGVALINTGMSELNARLLMLGSRAGARVASVVVPPLVMLPRNPSTRFEPISYRVIRRITSAPEASAGRVAFVHRMVLGCPAPVRAGFARLFGSLDLSDSIRHLTVPAIVVAGEKDLLLPPWHAQQIAAALPDLRELVELPGSGHMSPLEAPDAITSRLRQLAAETLAAPRSPAYAG